MKDYSINTKCVQAGYTPSNGEPRQIPIIQSTTFKYDKTITLNWCNYLTKYYKNCIICVIVNNN